ncbi:MAG: glycosyltransferase family 39 protein [Acidobacteria bacterium]|nr:glycosyltransferase family 39 protein [Acidobacteriota bacterium]
MRKIFLNHWRPAVLLFAAGLFLILPAMVKGIPKGGDLTYHYRVGVALYELLHQGDLQPGWNSLSNAGYGDISLRFYPPGFYYLLALARFLSGDWFTASLLVFVLLSLVGGLGIYAWGRCFLKPNLALVAGLFFIVNPYHVNELYESSMLPEYAACAVLPFAFAFVERLCQSGKTRDVILLGVAYALLVLTHLPLTVIGSVALAVYALMRIRRADYRRSLMRLTLAVGLGLAASAFYWVTMVEELGWMRGNKINPDLWYDYRYNFLFGKMVEGATTWWAGVLAFATLLMALPALVFVKKSSAKVNAKPSPAFINGEKFPPSSLGEATASLPLANHEQAVASLSDDAVQPSRPAFDEPHAAPIKALVILTILSFFLMLPVSRPVWAVLPLLKEVQFPWRWLTVASMLSALLGAASLPRLRQLAKTRLRPLALLAVGCLVIAISLTLFQVIRAAIFLPRSDFNSMMATIATSPSLPDYWLPIWAGKQPPAMNDEVEVAGRTITISSWQAEQRTFHLGAGQSGEARVRTYYYPHWRATANGEALATRPDADGILVIAVPQQAVTVELQFCEPRRVHFTNALSLLTWALLAASPLLWWRKRKAQKLIAVAAHDTE